MGQCKKCNDSGFIIDKNGKAKKCSCLLQKELTDYLKHYNKYKFNKKYATNSLCTDLLCLDCSENSFGSLVKSFLSLTYIQFPDTKWTDITGQDLVTVTFGDDETYLVGDLQEIDFLIIKLGRDSYNKALGMWLLNLLTKRKELGKLTWVYIYPLVTMSKIIDVYGDEFCNFIKDKHNFKSVKGDK